MITLRFLAALAVITFQASCAAVQAPLKMANGMVRAVGRTLHLSSENTRKPDDYKLESRNVKQAVAVNNSCAPEPEETGPMIAAR